MLPVALTEKVRFVLFIPAPGLPTQSYFTMLPTESVGEMEAALGIVKFHNINSDQALQLH